MKEQWRINEGAMKAQMSCKKLWFEHGWSKEWKTLSCCRNDDVRGESRYHTHSNDSDIPWSLPNHLVQWIIQDPLLITTIIATINMNSALDTYNESEARFQRDVFDGLGKSSVFEEIFQISSSYIPWQPSHKNTVRTGASASAFTTFSTHCCLKKM